MHHSKDLIFTFIRMLTFSRCTVYINNYSTLYMVHSIQQAFSSYYRMMVIFGSESFNPASLKLLNKTVLAPLNRFKPSSKIFY